MKIKDLIQLVWNYLRPHRKLVYFCIFLSTLASGISAVIPLVYGRLVDSATQPNPNLKLIFIILTLWLLFALFSNWISRFISFKGGWLGVGTYNDFVSDMYAHYISLPLSFHKEKRAGEQIEKISRAGSHLWNMVGGITFTLLPGFLTALVALILMALTEWRLTLVIAAILTIYTLATLIKTKPIVKAEKLSRKSWEKYWGSFYDSVHNIQSVKSYVKEIDQQKNLISFSSRVKNRMTDLFRAWRHLDAWQNNLQSIGFVLTFGLALWLLTRGSITAGILVSFVGYVNLVFRPFNQLADHYRTLQRGVVILDRALKLLDIDKELYDTGEVVKEVQGQIEFRNVSFAYDDKYKKVLRQINFTAQPGEVIALVGESGAGKTTLAGLISRYYDLNGGKILLDNKDIQDLELKSLRACIALVPQEISLFNDTLRKNLAYAKKGASDTELKTALQAANAWEFVRKFPKKLDQKVGERGIKLSTGQKQRIAIARAILRNPKILILDEATSALDSVSERLVQSALKRLIAGRTTFVIAHRLSTITHANKILVIDQGKLAEQGTHKELVKLKGVYWDLYSKQKF